MSQSNKRVVYIQSRHVSVTDKLRILWAICVVAHYRENNQQPSPYNFKNDFGEDEWQYWSIACRIASHFKLLDNDRMQLTPKGLAVVSNWQQVWSNVVSL